MRFPRLSPLTQQLFALPDYVQRENNICSLVNFFPEAQRLMDAISLGRIVEIGSEKGLNTAVLLEYAKRRGKQLVTVDPADVPFPFSPEKEPAFAFYREMSADYLKRKIPAEVIFMDGDHNYETVFADLGTIHEARKRSGIKLLFVHDVSWPWARQDIYYDPARVAKPHPFHAENSVSPYAEDRAPSISPGNYMTADSAGGPRNGVLTAVEDFLSYCGGSWHFRRLPVLYGIGILTCVDNLSAEERQRLLPLEDELVSHRELLGTLELNRIENLCEIDALRQELKNAGDVWRKDQAYIEKVNGILPELSGAIREKNAELARMRCEQHADRLRLQAADYEKGFFRAKLRKLNEVKDRQERELADQRRRITTLEQNLRRRDLELPAGRWRTGATICRSLLTCSLRNGRKRTAIRKALADGSVALLSLDIFDTLLLREHHSELKRFREVGEILHRRYPQVSARQFYHARSLAHYQAYRIVTGIEGCREPKAKEIFRLMVKILGLPPTVISELVAVELDYESAHLRLNRAVWELVLLARRRNIPVIAASDMYLGEEDLRKVFDRILPDPGAIETIYSSCDYGVSKASGLLYERIAAERQIGFAQILHLGDNRESDFAVPFVRYGIVAQWLPRSKCHTWFCRWRQRHEMANLKKGNVIHGL